MFDSVFRKHFAVWSTPLVKGLASTGIQPNHITLIGFILSLGAAYLVGIGDLGLGLFVWLLSRVADGMDGVLARHIGQMSQFGGFLDILLDMASYSVMIIGFSCYYPTVALCWKLILLGYILVITSVLALGSILNQKPPEENRSLDLRPGLAEAGETSLVYLLLCSFPALVEPICWLWIGALAITVMQRIFAAHRMLG